MGGPIFMAVLTILLIIAAAWIIYHFIIAYNSKPPNQEKLLRKIGYGKLMGLLALVTGIYGQMIGLYSMFSAIEEVYINGDAVKHELVFGGIKATMIVTIYGILIYLLSLVLWFVASLMIEKKFNLK